MACAASMLHAHKQAGLVARPLRKILMVMIAARGKSCRAKAERVMQEQCRLLAKRIR